MPSDADQAPEMLSTCWTSAGNVMPTRTGPASPLNIRDRVPAAAKAGFVGFGLGHADLAAARDAIGLPALAELLIEHGMRFVELEYIDNWWADGPDRAESDRMREDLFAAAPVIRANHIKVGAGMAGQAVDPDRMRTEFHRLASEAASVGVKIALEPAAFSALPTIDLGVDLVRDAAHPNGGLLVDIWHIYRCGMDYEEMSRVIAPEMVFAVELNDGCREVVGSMFEDTFDNRLLCGDGEFGVHQFIRAIRRLGYRGPWGVEMMSVEHRGRDVHTATRLAIESARRCLREA